MNKTNISILLLTTTFLILACGDNQNVAEDYIKRGNSKMAQGDFQDAIGEYTKAIEADPQFKSAYFNRGQAETSLHQLEDAVRDYSKAIELDPNYGTYYFARGMAKFALKEYHGAIPDFTKALQLEPGKHAEAYSGRGFSVILDQMFASPYIGKELTEDKAQTVQEAIKDFTSAIELKSRFAEAYCGRGIARNLLQEFDAAFADLNKSIELDPSFGQAYAHRGVTKIRMGKNTDGCLDFKRAEELGFAEATDLIKLYCK